MKQGNRFIYLLYYIKELDIQKFTKFLGYASKFSGKSKFNLLADSVYSVFKYNVSLMDYFSFRFFLLNSSERNKWAGTGALYEFQLKMNPLISREVLSDKIKFLNHFKPFIRRRYADFKALKSSADIIEEFMVNNSSRLVIKGSRGQIGAEVEVINCNDYSPVSLSEYMSKKGYDLIEEYIVQHPALMELSPSGLNTVRIITQLTGSHVDFLGCRLRISVNSTVDNMAAGNLAAAIDFQTGIVTDSAVYSDITKPEQKFHPVTGEQIAGFVIPFWRDVINLAVAAACHTPENRSVGWDIAITPDGPELIEGNHNWCKLLWQLPVKQGLINELEKYL